MLKPEVDSLVPGQTFDRRGFVKTALGSAFAAAVLPVMAQQAIKTDFAGLNAGEVTIPSGGFSMPAYRAQPEGKKNLPVVLVVSEIFGVHEHIADVCRRFAKLGYLAIAPELFARQGDPQSFGTIQELQREVIAKVPDAQVMGDLDAAVAWAGANGGDVSRVAITGFCWGGRMTWLYAAHSQRLKAGVAWYGQLAPEPTPIKPKNPIDLVGQLHAPVLGLYGGKDTGIPLEQVDRMKAALSSSSDPDARRSRFIVYPESGHAFHADYRPSYREADARDGWQKCLDWFRQHGVA
ncbi:putative hydrolase [Cupriavidus taiwanensis]|uniref:Putative hydrolase n=1 Tax=Cupriavidus taiwanensis TaxID=164546 RepID=A0A375GY22_9BURK|nr:dienelactone hydrolase family protein [Cupriavidus taiwanensis]SOY48441.1 putative CARBOXYMETHYLENEBUTENOLIDASE (DIENELACTONE HYDROLASE) [Cupriavidus taiwanensis]SOY48552.1 putative CARBOXYMETHYLENEBUTENOLIDASE (DIENELACTONE HYDROLASE) [Cupriavidus taiwanensis]SOY83082.1 putative CARBOXYMETHYLENEBUTENOLIDASE (DIENELACTONE HYDROLASE) [Cupriavidus taiwanensis]SOZ56308.1 putative CARBOXYMETHYLENEBUTENOLIDASE (DIENELACTONE HYDROLASE) [Cupriavidus taiwanensis]SOZ78855.1 putative CARBOXYMETHYLENE